MCVNKGLSFSGIIKIIPSLEVLDPHYVGVKSDPHSLCYNNQR